MKIKAKVKMHAKRKVKGKVKVKVKVVTKIESKSENIGIQSMQRKGGGEEKGKVKMPPFKIIFCFDFIIMKMKVKL